jgi:aspartate racemase
MLTAHTLASRDSDHINFLLSSRADTPDRSSFILGRSQSDPSPVMAEEAKRLQSAGATMLTIPCNTAHYFYEKIQDAVDIPVINIIEETARFCAHEGVLRVGVLATEGTSASGAYSRVFSRKGIAIEELTEDEQAIISRTIFDEIKSGKSPSLDDFFKVCDALMQRGCQRLILGCTELSLIKKNNHLPPYFIDSLEILALAAISSSGKEPTGFDSALMKFYGETGKGQA